MSVKNKAKLNIGVNRADVMSVKRCKNKSKKDQSNCHSQHELFSHFVSAD